jgi:hypothetical protein
LQVRQLATGDQDQTATGILEPSECRKSGGVDHAVMRQRAIVVRGEGEKNTTALSQRAVGSGSNVEESGRLRRGHLWIELQLDVYW